MRIVKHIKKTVKTFGKNTKDVVVTTGRHLKCDLKGRGLKEKVKKHIKVAKYKKRKLHDIKRKIGYPPKVNMESFY